MKSSQLLSLQALPWLCVDRIRLEQCRTQQEACGAVGHSQGPEEHLPTQILG